MVVTARLGMALNGGEGDDRGELGFRLGRILGAGRKNSRARVRCGPLYGARMRLVTSTVEEKLPPASRSRARLRAVTPARGEDEDDFVPRYLDEGVWAVVAGLVLGCLWAACWAVCWAARPGEAGKSPLLYFFLFSFLFYNSLLYLLVQCPRVAAKKYINFAIGEKLYLYHKSAK
jgi:hypothetical protein